MIAFAACVSREKEEEEVVVCLGVAKKHDIVLQATFMQHTQLGSFNSIFL